MTKLEELKAAYEASPGLLICDADTLDSRVFTFVCKAEELMPQLLALAEAAQNLIAMKGRYNTEIAYGRLEQTLEKLK